MKCIFCGANTGVMKTFKGYEGGTLVKRRRSCPRCGGRFSTFEDLAAGSELAPSENYRLASRFRGIKCNSVMKSKKGS